MLAEPPHTVLIALRETRAGTGGELPDVSAEFPPRQQPTAGRIPREKVGEADPVVLAQVRLDCLAVLPQESDEASDSPDAMPLCVW